MSAPEDVSLPMAPLEWRSIPKTWPGIPPGAMVFVHITKPLTAIRSYDRLTEGSTDPRWHLSVSHQDRIPTWEELGMARDALMPADMHFCLPHPPRRFWLNYNHRVLHLWEMDDETLTQHFEWEGKLAQEAGFGEPSSGEES